MIAAIILTTCLIGSDDCKDKIIKVFDDNSQESINQCIDEVIRKPYIINDKDGITQEWLCVSMVDKAEY